jgi:hypothetical protein
MHWSRFLALLALLLVPRAAWPQGTPVGPEFRVNTHTAGNQSTPSVAADASGNFVVVWNSFVQDGSLYGVFGQRYDSSGGPLGPEFRVNTDTTSDQRYPSVAADASGNFVVVWASPDGSAGGVSGQRYASSGAPLGPEFRVNTYTTSDQSSPSVAADASGNFVVVWTSFAQDGSADGVFGQRFASSGAPLGPEFRVNTYATSDQRSPAVAADASGNFVVVWEGQEGGTGAEDIFGQRYASTGAPLGPEFHVNAFRVDTQFNASVAADASGNFVVVWSSHLQDGPNFGVFGRRYDSAGALQGPEFRVNTFTTDDQWIPAAAASSSGDFVVVWLSEYQDGSGNGIFGQRYSQIVAVELTGFTVEAPGAR